VDLPQPLSPTSPSISPRRIEKLMPSTAWTTSRWPPNQPWPWTGKWTARSRTSSSGDAPFLRSSAGTVGSGAVWLMWGSSGHARGLVLVPAGGQVLRAGHRQGRRLIGAALADDRAARRERTAPRGPDQVRRLAGDALQLGHADPVQARD